MDFDPMNMTEEELLAYHRQTVERSRLINAEVNEALQNLAYEMEIMDSDPHALLTFEQAVLLPELRAAGITIKKLRRAQERGELQIARLDRKNHYVARAQIREWIKKCQESPSPRTSSGLPASTSLTVVSRQEAIGRSSMDRASSAQRSALSIVARLKTDGRKPSK